MDVTVRMVLGSIAIAVVLRVYRVIVNRIKEQGGPIPDAEGLARIARWRERADMLARGELDDELEAVRSHQVRGPPAKKIKPPNT